MLSKDLSFFIAIRFLRSRKQGFLSFVTALAFSCVALGVAVLIVVTSVMNGFETELRERILKTIPHASIEGIQPIKDWRSIYSKLKKMKILLVWLPLLKVNLCSRIKEKFLEQKSLGFFQNTKRRFQWSKISCCRVLLIH
jgi:ABC-type lipoprotein release transport system permease subunit